MSKNNSPRGSEVVDWANQATEALGEAESKKSKPSTTHASDYEKDNSSIDDGTSGVKKVRVDYIRPKLKCYERRESADEAMEAEEIPSPFFQQTPITVEHRAIKFKHRCCDANLFYCRKAVLQVRCAKCSHFTCKFHSTRHRITNEVMCACHAEWRCFECKEINYPTLLVCNNCGCTQRESRLHLNYSHDNAIHKEQCETYEKKLEEAYDKVEFYKNRCTNDSQNQSASSTDQVNIAPHSPGSERVLRNEIKEVVRSKKVRAFARSEDDKDSESEHTPSQERNEQSSKSKDADE